MYFECFYEIRVLVEYFIIYDIFRKDDIDVGGSIEVRVKVK